MGQEGHLGAALRLDSFAHPHRTHVGREARPDRRPPGVAHAARRQRSNVALDRRHHRVHREVAREEKGEVGGVGEALAIEIEDRPEFRGVHLGHGGNAVHVKAAGVHRGHRVLEHVLRTVRAVDEEGVEALPQRGKGVGILGRLGEGEMDELKRRLEVGRARRPRNAVEVVVHVGAHLDQVSGQELLEIRGLEPSHARVVHDLCRQPGARECRRVGHRQPTARVAGEHDLVGLEVGGLEPHLGAVREREHRGADLLDRPARLDTARLGQLAHERLARRAVLPGGGRLRAHARQHRTQRAFGGRRGARFLRHRDEHDAILLADHLAHQRVHLIDSDPG